MRKSSASDLLGEWAECAAKNADYGDGVVRSKVSLAENRLENRSEPVSR
jgi:hypothetical protein